MFYYTENLDIAKRMVKVNLFETKLLEYSPKGFIHTSIGQEHTSALAAEWAERNDAWIFTGHRPHGCLIARGVPYEKVLAEILRAPGSRTNGQGSSMNMYFREFKIMTSAKVGGPIGLALGATIAGQKAIAVIGDGAAQAGIFHECITWAKDLELDPKSFQVIVEQNGLAISHQPKNLDGVYHDEMFVDENREKIDLFPLNAVSWYARCINTRRPYGHYFWEKRCYDLRNRDNKDACNLELTVPESIKGELAKFSKIETERIDFAFRSLFGGAYKIPESLLDLSINK